MHTLKIKFFLLPSVFSMDQVAAFDKQSIQKFSLKVKSYTLADILKTVGNVNRVIAKNIFI